MIHIYLNSSQMKLENSISLEKLLHDCGYAGKTFAVAVNREFVPKKQYPLLNLNHDDCIDIVMPMQGG